MTTTELQNNNKYPINVSGKPANIHLSQFPPKYMIVVDQNTYAHISFENEENHITVEVTGNTSMQGSVYNRFCINSNAEIITCPKINHGSSIVYGDGSIAGGQQQHEKEYQKTLTIKPLTTILEKQPKKEEIYTAIITKLDETKNFPHIGQYLNEIFTRNINQ